MSKETKYLCRRRVAAACCAVLLVAWSACSTKDDPKQAVLGDRYPENFAFAKERCDRVGYHSLRPRELVVYYLGCFEAEMDNGGFHQFFLNSAGDHTRKAGRCIHREMDGVEMSGNSGTLRAPIGAAVGRLEDGPVVAHRVAGGRIHRKNDIA